MKMEETEREKRSRIRSIYLIHMAMLVFSLGFSINITGVFPYMKQLLPSVPTDLVLERYGWIIALNPLGQMISSPILGYIYNKTQNLRIISVVMAITYVLGNSLYALLTLIPREEDRYIALMLSRFVVGASSGVAAPMRAYISSATFMSERTEQLSMNSLFQTLGFIIGPVIQASLTPVQCAHPKEAGPYFALDMFTISGWISASMGVACTICFLPQFFKHFDVTEAQRSKHANLKKKTVQEMVLKKPDYIASVVLLFDFFVAQAVFVLLETLATPLCMDQFGYTEEETIVYLGILMSVGGAGSLLCFFSVGPISKKVDERYLLYFVGLILMLIGRLFMFSFGSQLPPPAFTNNSTLREHKRILLDEGSFLNSSFVPFAKNGECSTAQLLTPGCSYSWCKYVPALTLWQFIVSYVFCIVSYPYVIALCQSIFTKVIGPRPQGTWMGALASSGSLARVSGPIIVSQVYKEYGLNIMSAILSVLVFISIIASLSSHKRLVPLIIDDRPPSEVDVELSEHKD